VKMAKSERCSKILNFDLQFCKVAKFTKTENSSIFAVTLRADRRVEDFGLMLHA